MVFVAPASDFTAEGIVFTTGVAVAAVTFSTVFSVEGEPVVPVGSFVDVGTNVAGRFVDIGVDVVAGGSVGFVDGVGVVLLITVKYVFAVPVGRHNFHCMLSQCQCF